MFEEKIFDVSINILALFSLSRGVWISCGGTRTEGRKEYGNVRTRGNPVSVHEKWTRWIYHFFA